MRRNVGATGPFLRTLRELRNENTSTEIKFSDASQRRIAGELAGLFKQAGWDTNFNELPINSYNMGFTFDGVEVSGRSEYLVNRVAGALKRLGIVDTRRAVQTTENIRPDNPKYQWAQNRITIMIGDEI